jgi:Lipocalin-like domain
MSELIGTWRLVITRAFDENGVAIAAPYGPKPMGLAMFHADGRMMAVLSDSRPELPASERDYVSYCGRYVVERNTLRTRVDGATHPDRIGGDQVRTISYENGLLKLSPPPRTWRGATQRHELLWEKVG